MSVCIGIACSCVLACSSGEERPAPAPKSGEPIANLRACGELMDASVSHDQLVVGDAAAGCAVDLLECPLLDRAELCVDAGSPQAICARRVWTLVCSAPADAAP